MAYLLIHVFAEMGLVELGAAGIGTPVYRVLWVKWVNQSQLATHQQFLLVNLLGLICTT